MTFLPIVARELRVASRRRGTYSGRLWAAMIPIAVAVFWLPVLASQFSLSQGKALFSALSILTFGYCLLAGARSTSDCLSGEKREGTIGLLFLTDLKGYDVVLGKLVSSSLAAFYGLLATVPVLSLALLLGGVTLSEVGRMALLFANTLLFSMAAGVFASTLSRHDRRAMFATLCIVLATAAIPYVLAAGYALLKWQRFGQVPGSIFDLQRWLMVSPVYAFYILRSSLVSSTMVQSFYHSILTTHLLAWALLIAASLIIPHTCRERPPGKLGTRWLHFRNRWSYGKPSRRQAFRARLLDQNAFYWLAARDRIKAYYVWFFVAALGLIWCWTGWLVESFIFDWDMSFWLLFLLFAFLKVWLTSEVCNRLVEDRASGAFELLLSSPLDLREMAHGQTLALRRQFGWPVLVVLLLTYLLMRSSFRASHSGIEELELRLLFWSLMIMLAADLVTLKWVGMWQAVTTNQVNRATMAACSRVLLLPTVVFVVGYASVWLAIRAMNPAGESRWILGGGCLVWLAIGLTNNLYFGLRARWQFLHHFRDVATQRYQRGMSPGLEPFRQLLRRVAGSFRREDQRAPGTRSATFAWKRWLLITPAFLLLCGLGILVWHKHTLVKEVAARRAAIRVAGDPLTWVELRSWTTPPVNAENAGLVLQNAARSIKPAYLFQKTLPALRNLEWPGPTATLSTEQRSAVTEWLEQNQDALTGLHESAKKPKSSYPVVFGSLDPSMAYWQTLHQLSPAIQLLQFEALLRSEDGDLSGALDSIRALLGIARAMEQEPVLPAQSYRGYCLRAAVRVLERVLHQHPLPPEILAELDHRLHDAELRTGPALGRGFRGERCFVFHDFISPRARSAMAMPPPNAVQQFVQDFVQFAGDQLGLREQILLDRFDVLDQYVGLAQKVEAGDLTAQRPSPPGPNSPEDSSRQAQRAMFESSCRDQVLQMVDLVALLRAAQAALTVETYRAAHPGQWPPDSGRPIPDSIVDWPADPFQSGPLLYQEIEKGYIIYSVGRDGRDNGGVDRDTAKRAALNTGSDIIFRVRR